MSGHGLPGRDPTAGTGTGRRGYTDQDGNYDVEGLKAGTYRIGFKDSNGDNLKSSGTTNLTSSRPSDIVVAPTAPSPARTQSSPPRPHHRPGHDGTGLSLSDVEVTAYRMIGGTWTETDGLHRRGRQLLVDGLRPGPTGSSFHWQDEYADEYWDDAGTIATRLTWSSVPPNRAGKNAVLAAASHITGRVIDGSGLSLSGVEVTAYR